MSERDDDPRWRWPAFVRTLLHTAYEVSLEVLYRFTSLIEGIDEGLRRLHSVLTEAPAACQRGWKTITRVAASVFGIVVASTSGLGLPALDGRVGWSIAAGSVFSLPLLVAALSFLRSATVRESTPPLLMAGFATDDAGAQLLAERLEHEASLRTEIHKRSRPDAAPLEEQPFVTDMIEADLLVCRQPPISSEVAILLVRVTDCGAYAVVRHHGIVERELRSGTTWCANDVLAAPSLFSAVLDPLGYGCVHTPFAIGRAQYVLLAVGPDDLPAELELVVSRLATRLMRQAIDAESSGGPDAYAAQES